MSLSQSDLSRRFGDIRRRVRDFREFGAVETASDKDRRQRFREFSKSGLEDLEFLLEICSSDDDRVREIRARLREFSEHRHRRGSPPEKVKRAVRELMSHLPDDLDFLLDVVDPPKPKRSSRSRSRKR